MTVLAPPLPTKASEMTTNDDFFASWFEGKLVNSIYFANAKAKNDNFRTLR